MDFLDMSSFMHLFAQQNEEDLRFRIKHKDFFQRNDSNGHARTLVTLLRQLWSIECGSFRRTQDQPSYVLAMIPSRHLLCSSRQLLLVSDLTLIEALYWASCHRRLTAMVETRSRKP